MPSRRKRSSSSLSSVSHEADRPTEIAASSPKRAEGGEALPAKKASKATPKSTKATRVKKEETDEDPKPVSAPSTPARRSTRSTATPASKKVKLEDGADDLKDVDVTKFDEDEEDEKKPTRTPRATPGTLAKKLKQLEAYLQTPFPDFSGPTPEQCQEVEDALSSVHGKPSRPDKLEDREGAAAGCGAVPDVLDALVRTILSQNTTSASQSLRSLRYVLLIVG